MELVVFGRDDAVGTDRERGVVALSLRIARDCADEKRAVHALLEEPLVSRRADLAPARDLVRVGGLGPDREIGAARFGVDGELRERREDGGGGGGGPAGPG